MRSTKYVFIIFLFFHVAEPQYEKNVAGPYTMRMIMVEPCENVGKGEYEFYIKTKRISRSQTVYDGTFILKKTFDDNLMLSLNVGQYTNGGIKKNFFKKDFPHACSTFRNYVPKAMSSVLEQASIPRKKCPIPPGNYTARNFTLDENFANVPIFFYNTYKLEVVFLRSGQRVACHYFYYELFPKKGQKKH